MVEPGMRSLKSIHVDETSVSMSWLEVFLILLLHLESTQQYHLKHHVHLGEYIS